MSAGARGWVFAAAALWAALAWSRAAARPAEPPSPFVGASACATCHEDVARTWAAGPHAAPTPGPAGTDSRCAPCHATGGGPASSARLPGVQCEACHGAGEAYAPEDIMRNRALARALGLRDLSTPAARAAVCDVCHRARTTLRPFAAERAWREFGHGASATAL